MPSSRGIFPTLGSNLPLSPALNPRQVITSATWEAHKYKYPGRKVETTTSTVHADFVNSKHDCPITAAN